MSTHIEWTDETWNPIVGCTKISEGCRHCYAARFANRLQAMGHEAYQNTTDKAGWTGQVNLNKEALNQPQHWKKPRRIFVNSMSDLFHESVHLSWIMHIFGVMEECPQHTFQILTKRPERMYQFCSQFMKRPLPNVWLGTSVENQAALEERVQWLLNTPAAVRFLSCEPLLGPLDLKPKSIRFQCLICGEIASDHYRAGHEFTNRGIDWVIVGGESGPGARPTNPAWVRKIKDQCQLAEIPFFFKQWGEWSPIATCDGHHESPFEYVTTKPYFGFQRLGKKRSGRKLDGLTYNEFPQLPQEAKILCPA